MNLHLGGGGKTSRSKGLQVFTLAEGATHVAQSAKPRRAAFTLAEVLITLGIIGVVAAMTLPTLMQNYQKAQTVSQLKKTYAVAQNAVQMIRAEYDGNDMLGMPFVHELFGHSQYFDLGMFGEELSKHLNYGEKTYDSTFITELKLCLPLDSPKIYKFANGEKQTAWGQGEIYWWILNDGSCLAMLKRGGWSWDGKEGTSRVLMLLDVNGSEKNPNQFGKDTFIFELTHNGSIIPYAGEHGDDCFSKDSGWNASGFACAKKIVDDGWQIKHDYKWQ